MKFHLIHQQTNGQSPVRVVEQTTGREVGWINRFLDREFVSHRSAGRPHTHDAVAAALNAARERVRMRTIAIASIPVETL